MLSVSMKSFYMMHYNHSDMNNISYISKAVIVTSYMS